MPKKVQVWPENGIFVLFGQALPAHLVGGCGAWAVSRKTLIYFIEYNYAEEYQNPETDFIFVMLLYKSETVNLTTVNCRQLRLFFCYMVENWSVSLTDKRMQVDPEEFLNAHFPSVPS